MWIYEHSVDTPAEPASVWALLSDLSSWSGWNAGVEGVDLNGPFAVGTQGTMRMPEQEPLRFRLIQVEEGSGFEDETPIPARG